MFQQKVRKGQRPIPTQRILAISPWLWAYQTIWTEGCCCQYGYDELDLTLETLRQEWDRFDDGETYVFLLCQSGATLFTCEVARDGPSAQGKTVAERMVTALWPISEDLRVRQVVVRTPGQVDRTYEFYLYGFGPRFSETTESLLPKILEAVNGFKPVFAPVG